MKTFTFNGTNIYITNANLKRSIESIDSAEIDIKELFNYIKLTLCFTLLINVEVGLYINNISLYRL